MVNATSFGSTEQDFSFSAIRLDPTGNLVEASDTQNSQEFYRRHVIATNGSVVEDDERHSGGPVAAFT